MTSRATPTLDVAYVNPFIRAVNGLFTTMVKVPSTLGKPRLREKDEDLSRRFVVSVEIGLQGGPDGVVAVSFMRPVALAVASSLAGCTFQAIDDDCRDALGEIGNMLVGQAKVELPGGGASMSVPRVIDTADLMFPTGPVLLVPFDTPVGRFLVGAGWKA